MNIYRQLAENVWNPKMSSGADIQRQLDLMDQFQSSAPTSNIDYAMAPTMLSGVSSMQPNIPSGYDEGGEGRIGPEPGFTGVMADDPYGWQTMAYGLTGYGFGLPKDVKESRFPSPFGRFSGLPGTVMGQIAPTTGLPGGLWGSAFRTTLNPLMSAVLGALGMGRGYAGPNPDYATNPEMQRSRDEYQETQYGGWSPMSSNYGEFSNDIGNYGGFGLGNYGEFSNDIGNYGFTDTSNEGNEGTSTGW